MVSQTICLGLALNCDPPDLCLLSSWDYRHTQLTFFLSISLFSMLLQMDFFFNLFWIVHW
jgi:hypothetical protein